MSEDGVFELVDDVIVPRPAPRPASGFAAALFGAPLGPNNVARSATSTTDELAALMELARGAGQPLAAGLLVMESAAELDQAAVQTWLRADAGRLGVVLTRRTEHVEAVLAHPLTAEGQVAPAGSLSDCFDLSLNVAELLRSGAWALDEAARNRAADVVFAVALSPRPAPLSWQVVAGIATRLLEFTSYDSRAGWELTFARAVALRHQGVDALLEWPEELEDRSVAERWTILAHVVQSAADGDLGRAHSYANAAIEALASSPNASAEDSATQIARWRLRGAIGRALAAAGAYGGAREHLDACIAHWLGVGTQEELSFPLCEALRVAGVERDSEVLGRLRVHAERVVAGGDPGGYVRLALGRAMTQLDHPEDATAHLRSVVAATSIPEHVHAAACRWLVKASVAMGAWTEATRSRELLEKLVPLPDQAHLARLDEALRQQDPDAARRAVEGLLACGPLAREARRTLTRIRASGTSSDEVAALSRLADEYRY